jgi:hypothetical protein
MVRDKEIPVAESESKGDGTTTKSTKCLKHL